MSTATTTVGRVVDLQPISNGIAMPGPGRWAIHPSSFAGLTVHKNRAVPAKIIAGAVTVDPAGGEPILLELETAHPDMQELVANADDVGVDSSGFARYHLRGYVTDVNGARRPHELLLAFHGVYRRSGQTSAWFSGVTTRRSRSRRRPAPSLVLDLVASPLITGRPTERPSEGSTTP